MLGWAVKNCLIICQGAIQPDVAYPEVYLEQVWRTAKRAYRDVKDEAASIGTEAHRAIEAHLRGEPVLSPDGGAVGKCVSAALNWMGEHEFRPLEVERYVYSRKHRFSGTLDCLAYVDGELAIVDWKSSKSIFVEYWLQTAAYQGAFQEETGQRVSRRYIVRLGKDDGAFEVQSHSGLGGDYQAFLGALKLQRHLEKLRAESRG